MRKDQIDAAGVNVDRRLAEQAQRHRRALEVPARTARRIDDVPRRLARLGRLPQHEVARVFLGVVVGVDARARLHAVVIEARQLAVVGQRRDLEVDRSVAAVGVAVAARARAIRSRHRAAGSASSVARGVLLDLLEAERPRVLAKRRDVLVGVGAQVHAGLLRAGDRAVVDVGEVHHLPHAGSRAGASASAAARRRRRTCGSCRCARARRRSGRRCTSGRCCPAPARTVSSRAGQRVVEAHRCIRRQAAAERRRQIAAAVATTRRSRARRRAREPDVAAARSPSARAGQRRAQRRAVSASMAGRRRSRRARAPRGADRPACASDAASPESSSAKRNSWSDTTRDSTVKGDRTARARALQSAAICARSSVQRLERPLVAQPLHEADADRLRRRDRDRS